MIMFFTTKQEIIVSLPHDECGYSPREKMKILANQLGLILYFILLNLVPFMFLILII